MFMRAVHPGTVLKDELGVTPTEFARQIDVPPNRVSQIITGKRGITGDTALRFGHWFGTDPQFWLNLQAQYELAVADKETGEAIRHLPTRATLLPQPEQPRLASRRVVRKQGGSTRSTAACSVFVPESLYAISRERAGAGSPHGEGIMAKGGSKSSTGGGARTVNKSAATGRFVSNKAVSSSPKTTYKQTTKPSK